jgi:hypothetical protein
MRRFIIGGTLSMKAMSKLRLVFVAGVCVGGIAALTACQQGVSGPTTAMPGFGLHYIDEGQSAKLAYGQANSDNVGLMLECAKGSSRVEITDLARGDNRTLVLKSGKARSDFGASVAPGPGIPILQANGRVDTPALKAFRESGRIEVENGARRYGVSATPAEHADVKRFFAACERT